MSLKSHNGHVMLEGKAPGYSACDADIKTGSFPVNVHTTVNKWDTYVLYAYARFGVTGYIPWDFPALNGEKGGLETLWASSTNDLMLILHIFSSAFSTPLKLSNMKQKIAKDGGVSRNLRKDP